MNEEIESMQGQLLALSSVLTAVISSLGQYEAAQAAAQLLTDMEEQAQEDASTGTNTRVTRSRDHVANAYFDLLKAKAGIA